MLRRLLDLRTQVLVGVVGLLLAVTAFAASGGFSHGPGGNQGPARAAPTLPADASSPSPSPTPTAQGSGSKHDRGHAQGGQGGEGD